MDDSELHAQAVWDREQAKERDDAAELASLKARADKAESQREALAWDALALSKRANDAEASLDELARVAGVALLEAGLADGEQLVSTPQHALWSSMHRLRTERDEARRQLRAEQDAGRRVVARISEALGTWEGSWETAAIERIKKGTP